MFYTPWIFKGRWKLCLQPAASRFFGAGQPPQYVCADVNALCVLFFSINVHSTICWNRSHFYESSVLHTLTTPWIHARSWSHFTTLSSICQCPIERTLSPAICSPSLPCLACTGWFVCYGMVPSTILNPSLANWTKFYWWPLDYRWPTLLAPQEWISTFPFWPLLKDGLFCLCEPVQFYPINYIQTVY